MWVWIRPKPDSIALEAWQPVPPTFEILADAPHTVAIEVATQTELFIQAGRRNPPGRPYNYFNSMSGLQPQQVSGQTLTAGSTLPTTYTLPVKVWMLLRHSNRLFYRAYPVYGIGQTPYNSPQDIPYTPYIHIIQTTDRILRASYTPRRVQRNLPALMVEGNKLIDGRRSTGPASSTAKPKVLRGVNISGLFYREPGWYDQSGRPSTRWIDAAGITQDWFTELGQNWNAKIIRLPVNQDWVLNGVARKSGLNYLQDIDQIIDWAAQAGMYTLLDLQVLRAPEYIGSMPDNLSLVFWKMLARRYSRDPAVLFDLSNEPHHPYDGKYANSREPQYHYQGPMMRYGKDWIDLWHEWARTLTAVIHHSHYDAVVFVSGIDGPCWAASLRSMPIPLARFSGTQQFLPNVVYSCHIYRREEYKQKHPIDPPTNTKIGTLNKSHWDYWFGFPRLRQNHPIFLGEWGGLDPDPKTGMIDTKTELAWGGSLEQYLRGLHRADAQGHWQGLAGWTAWSWGDQPHLVKRKSKQLSPPNVDRQFEVITHQGRIEHVPTSFGNLVKASLQKP